MHRQRPRPSLSPPGAGLELSAGRFKGRTGVSKKESHMIRTILSLAALIAFAGEVYADDAKCCKDGAKDKVTTSAKEGFCAEKAQLIAAKVLAESCPVASAAILASELP